MHSWLSCFSFLRRHIFGGHDISIKMAVSITYATFVLECRLDDLSVQQQQYIAIQLTLQQLLFLTSEMLELSYLCVRGPGDNERH